MKTGLIVIIVLSLATLSFGATWSIGAVQEDGQTDIGAVQLTAAAPPAGVGRLIMIMTTGINPCLIVIGIISILAGALGISKRKAA